MGADTKDEVIDNEDLDLDTDLQETDYDESEDLTWDDDSDDDLDDDAAPEGAEDDDDLESDAAGSGEDADVDEGQFGLPDLPDGYANWGQVVREAQQQRQLRAQQQYVPPQPQQQQQVPPQQQPSPGFQWQLPHELDEEIALGLQVRQSPEAFAKLPQHVQQKTLEYAQYVDGNWNRWRQNPYSFVEDVVGPTIGPMLQRLERGLAELHANSFRQRNADILDDPQGVEEYLELSQQGTSPEAALELIRLRRQVYGRARQGAERSAKDRDRRARAKAAKGKPARKKRPSNRSGKRNMEIPKGQRSDARAIARRVLKSEGLDGE